MTTRWVRACPGPSCAAAPRQPSPPSNCSRGAPRIEGAPFDRRVFVEEVLSRRFLGLVFLFVSRPAAVRHILVTNAAGYVRPQAAVRVLAPPIGGGLFLSEGSEWRRQRRLLAPSFAPRATADFLGHAAEITENLIRDLAQAAPGEADLYAAVQQLTLAIAARALLSIDVAPWNQQIRETVTAYAGRLGRPGMLDLLLPAGIPSLRDLRRRRFRRRWMALVAAIVAERLQRPDRAPDLFDRLRRSAPDQELLHEHVATLLVTGSETTGAALYWALYLIADCQELQDAMAAEAAGAVQDADQRPLARAVVHESMRLFPPAFSIVRQALAADDAAGIAIPRGAIVQTAPFVLHRHQKLWARPDEFDPSRFQPGVPPPDRFAYMPFGVGPRACIAAQLALEEAVLALSMLVHAFRIAPTTPRAVTPTAQITLQPLDPAPFHITPRPAVSARHAPAAYPSP